MLALSVAGGGERAEQGAGADGGGFAGSPCAGRPGAWVVLPVAVVSVPESRSIGWSRPECCPDGGRAAIGVARKGGIRLRGGGVGWAVTVSGVNACCSR